MPMTREQLAQLLMQSKRSPEQMAGGVPQNAPLPQVGPQDIPPQVGDTGGRYPTVGDTGGRYPTVGDTGGSRGTFAGPAGTSGAPFPDQGVFGGPAGTSGAPFNTGSVFGAPDDPTQSGITPELLNDPAFLEYFRKMTGKPLPGAGGR